MAEHTLTKRYILVVDDEEKVASGLRDGLEILLDCEVAIATGGEQALQFCKQRPFNLLITDYQMPDMNGLVLAARVQQLHPQTYIIMLTAHNSDTLREHAARASIRQILDKPARLGEIRSAVLQALSQQTLSQSER
jgi:CheY-like chemotaxis protein